MSWRDKVEDVILVAVTVVVLVAGATVVSYFIVTQVLQRIGLVPANPGSLFN